jgi:hypothetical protein
MGSGYRARLFRAIAYRVRLRLRVRLRVRVRLG